jgi:hypothetical protein
MRKHWVWPPLQLPNGGMLGIGPDLPQYIDDILLLGDRVAYCLEDDALWGADGIITFMTAPGAPWEGQ